MFGNQRHFFCIIERRDRETFTGSIAVLTLATRMFVINEKLFLFAIVDRYPFASCAKDIFV